MIRHLFSYETIKRAFILGNLVALLFLSSSLAQEAQQQVEVRQQKELQREKEQYIKELEKPLVKKTEKKKKAKEEGLLKGKPTFGNSFIYFEDSIDDRIRQMTNSVLLYHSEDHSIIYGQDQTKYEDRGTPNIYSQTYWIEWRTSHNENLSTSAYYGFKDYHNGGSDENIFLFRLNHIWKDKLLTQLLVDHQDITQNNEAILENLEVTRYASFFEWLHSEKLVFQWGYMYGNYSDHNDSDLYYGGATITWLDFPIIKTSYQYSYTRFGFESPFYFSADRFQNHLISFAWEHNVSKQFGYALRNRVTNDDIGREAWASQLIGELFLAPRPNIFIFAQYAYYDSEVLDGKSFTSNSIFLTTSITF